MILLFGINLCFAQNLVPNHSFEEYWKCPVGGTILEYANNWINPTNASPDYYNACSIFSGDVPLNTFGYQEAHTGNAYAGFGLYNKITLQNITYDYREYIQIQLIEALENNKKYKISFFISLSDSVEYSINNIGICFSDTMLYYNSMSGIPLIPQIDYSTEENSFFLDKKNWMEISTQIVANGGEKFLTIGNFRTNVNTDTLFVGNGAITETGFNGVYYYIDDVSLTLDTTNGINDDLKAQNELFRVFPNPANNELNINLLNVSNNAVYFELYDVLGKKIFQIQLNNLETKIDISKLPKAFYLYKLKINDKIFSDKLIIEK